MPLEPDFTDSDNTTEIDIMNLPSTKLLQTDKPSVDVMKTTSLEQEKELASENIVDDTIHVYTEMDCNQNVALVTETVNFFTDAKEIIPDHNNLPKAIHLADSIPDTETTQDITNIEDIPNTEDITMENTIVMDTIDNSDEKQKTTPNTCINCLKAIHNIKKTTVMLWKLTKKDIE